MHWSQFVPNVSTDIRGHEGLLHRLQDSSLPVKFITVQEFVLLQFFVVVTVVVFVVVVVVVVVVALVVVVVCLFVFVG